MGHWEFGEKLTLRCKNTFVCFLEFQVHCPYNQIQIAKAFTQYPFLSGLKGVRHLRQLNLSILCYCCHGNMSNNKRQSLCHFVNQ